MRKPSFLSGWNGILSTLTSNARKPRKVTRLSRRMLACEPLEERQLLSLTWAAAGGGDWNCAANWVDENLLHRVPIAGDDLVFPTGVTTNNDMPAGLSISSITIGASNAALTGNAIALGSGGITVNAGVANATIQMTEMTLSATVPVTMAANSSLTVSSVLSGSGGLNLGGDVGTLALTGQNTYTNGTKVLAGTLLLAGGDDRLSASGDITVGGGTLDLGGNVQHTSGTVHCLGGAVTNGTITCSAHDFDVQAGTIDATLDGSVGLTKSGPGTLILSHTNTYAGGTEIGGGELRAEIPSALPRYSEPNAIALFGGATLVVPVGGVDDWSDQADELMAGVAINGGRVTFDVPTGQTFEFAPTVAGTISIGKRGDGALILSGANSYSGGTLVEAGTLTLGNGSAIGASNNGIVVSGGATLDINGQVVTAGAVVLVDGTIDGAGDTLTASSYTVASGTVSANLGGTSTAQLVKIGDGAVVLTGSNTYGGLTSVYGGTLEVSLSARSPILSGGGANIHAGKVILDYTDSSDNPASQIGSILATSYGASPHFSVDHGANIYSSNAAAAGMALGWRDNGQDAGVCNKQVTVAYTRYADANLSGNTDSSDLLVLINHFGTTSGASWQEGDFNYDGKVESSDLLILTNNYGQWVSSQQPEVSQIYRLGAETSMTSSAQFLVVLSQEVSGVEATDFRVTLNGQSYSLARVSVVGYGSETNKAVYVVTVSDIYGTGTLSLELSDQGTTIANDNGCLSGPGAAGQPSFASEAYTVASPFIWDGEATEQEYPDSYDKWSTAKNWVGDVAPGIGDSVVFTGSANTSVDIGGASFRSVEIAADGFTLHGNAAVVNYDGENVYSARIVVDAGVAAEMTGIISFDTLTEVDVQAGGSLTLSGQLLGQTQLTKTGSGMLVLGKNGQLDGDLSVAAGTLDIEKAVTGTVSCSTLGLVIGNASPVKVSSPISNISVHGSTTTSGQLPFEFNNGQSSLTYAVIQELDPDDIISSITLNGTSLALTYNGNAQYGMANVTVRATDAHGVFADMTFLVNVDRSTDVSRTASSANQATPSVLTNGSLMLPFSDLGLQYISSASYAHPIISADAQLNATNNGSYLSQVDTTLTLSGVAGSVTQYYTARQDFSLVCGATFINRFSSQIDASSLSTGRYDWTMTITARYQDNSTQTITVTGYQDVLNWNDSPFGKGWQLSSLDWLVRPAGSDNVCFVSGDGTMALFKSVGSGVYASEAGPMAFSTLSGDWTNGFTLTGTDGVKKTFDASGHLVLSVDRDGNVTRYCYDATTGRLTSVTDSDHHTTAFGYDAAGLVATITDFAGRQTTLTHSSGCLTKIQQPEPITGTGHPTTVFAYDPTTGLISSVTDADGHLTQYTYSFAGTLATVQEATEPVSAYTSMQFTSLRQTSPTSRAPAVVVATRPYSYSDDWSVKLFATHTDQLGRTTNYTFDRFGLVTSTVQTHTVNGMPTTITTTTTRDDNGLVTEVDEPKLPDGDFGGQQWPITTYRYDNRGNLIERDSLVYHWDTSYPYSDLGLQEIWTYQTFLTRGGPLDAVTRFEQSQTTYTYGDGPSLLATVYDIDPATGDLLSERRVVGQIDGDGGNTETDDVVTSYTYTRHAAGANASPGGLVATTTDPNGHTTACQYNAHGLLTQITYALGTSDQASVSYQYDSADNLHTVTDERGQETIYDYDVLGHVITVTQPADTAGQHPVTQYQYDLLGNLIQEIDPLNRVTTWHYNDLGQLDQITEPGPDNGAASSVTTFTYTDTGLLETVTDPLLGVTTYAYDDLGRQVSVTGPAPDPTYPAVNRPVTSYAYDDLGRITKVIDPNNSETDYQYDGATMTVYSVLGYQYGQAVSAKNVYGYDAFGLLRYRSYGIAVTNDLSAGIATYRTDYSYDDLGYAVQGESLSGAMLGSTYDKNGNILSETDNLGNVTDYQYDARNRLISKTLPSPDGVAPRPVYTYAYDDAGNLTSETDPAGNVTTYVYDNLNRLIEQIDPNPATGLSDETDPNCPKTHYTYDLVGNLLSETDPLSRVTTYTYDGQDSCLTVTDASGTTTYTHDKLGHITSLEDADGNLTQWTYDGLGRVTKEIDPLGQIATYQYDAVGNLIEKKDRDGRVTVYAYDVFGNQTFEYWYANQTAADNDADRNDADETIAYTYDTAGNLLSASDSVGGVNVSYVYGSSTSTGVTTPGYVLVGGQTTSGYYNSQWVSTRETASIAGLTVVLDSTYYDTANRQTLSATVNGVKDFVTTYTYDRLGQVTDVTQTSQTAGNTVAQKRADFTYNNLGEFDTVSRYKSTSGGSVNEVATSDYNYDHVGQLTSLTHAHEFTTLTGYAWQYDLAAQLTQMVSLADASTQNYYYDAAGQLTSITDAGDVNTIESHSYDATGNRTEGTYAHSTGNRLTYDSTYGYIYDNEGNQIAKYEGSAPINNVMPGDATNVTTYTYDNRNRLVEVDTPDGKTVKYTYDAFNRLVEEVVTTPVLGGDPTIAQTVFVYDGANIVLQFAKTGTGDLAATDLAHRYLWGPAVDEVLADEQVHYDANAQTLVTDHVYWALTDHQGSVRDIVDNTGAVVDHRVYDGFGKLTSTPATDFLFAYTGRMLDRSGSDLQFNVNRWYDASVGRWLSEDPVGFRSGGVNLSRYCGNSPANYGDPNGLKEISWRGGQAYIQGTPSRSETAATAKQESKDAGNQTSKAAGQDAQKKPTAKQVEEDPLWLQILRSFAIVGPKVSVIAKWVPPIKGTVPETPPTTPKPQQPLKQPQKEQPKPQFPARQEEPITDIWWLLPSGKTGMCLPD